MPGLGDESRGGPPGLLGVRRERDDDEEQNERTHARRLNEFHPNIGDFSLDSPISGHFAARIHSSTSGVPRGAIIRTEHKYNGKQPKGGSVIVLVGKSKKALVHLCMYTKPAGIGKALVQRLEKQHGGNTMKQRHDGIEWVGVDETGMLKGSKFLHKMGWFANAGTAGSSAKLFHIIKSLSYEISNSRMPFDFYIADIEMNDAEVRVAQQHMNNLVNHFEPDDENDGAIASL